MRRYLIFAVVLILGFIFFNFFPNAIDDPFESQAKKHRYVVIEAHKLIGFNLVDPEEAPPEVRDSVLRGYSIIMNTPFFAPNYAKDLLSCTSCHFAGGDTIGGRNNGISLVGVTNVYPRFSARSNKTITLADRINNCFERSMSGKPLPVDSQEMQDMLAYLAWISKEVESIKNPPWLGVTMLKSQHKPDIKQGNILYQKYCASCHRDNGEGGGKLPEPVNKTIPPLWGENSFNDGAGMSMLPMFSAFVYWNMPYQNSVLTEEEAIDIAAFVLEQPRPHFEQ